MSMEVMGAVMKLVMYSPTLSTVSSVISLLRLVIDFVAYVHKIK